MKKKFMFPVLCMVVTIAGAVCECISSVKQKDLEEMIADEVANQLSDKEAE